MLQELMLLIFYSSTIFIARQQIAI